MERKIITVSEIIKHYRISRQTIYRAVKAGKLKSRNFAGGRKVFFYADEVEKLLK